MWKGCSAGVRPDGSIIVCIRAGAAAADPWLPACLPSILSDGGRGEQVRPRAAWWAGRVPWRRPPPQKAHQNRPTQTRHHQQPRAGLRQHRDAARHSVRPVLLNTPFYALMILMLSNISTSYTCMMCCTSRESCRERKKGAETERNVERKRERKVPAERDVASRECHKREKERRRTIRTECSCARSPIYNIERAQHLVWSHVKSDLHEHANGCRKSVAGSSSSRARF